MEEGENAQVGALSSFTLADNLIWKFIRKDFHCLRYDKDLTMVVRRQKCR